MMALQMPKLPTAEEIRAMSAAQYEAYRDSLYNLCYQCIGASGAVVCDCHDIRKDNPEVREFLDHLDDYYFHLIDEINEALDWMFKVRFEIK